MKKAAIALSAILLLSLSAFSQQQRDTSRRGSVTITFDQAQQMYYFADHADDMKHRQIEDMKAFLNHLFAQAFPEPADTTKKTIVPEKSKK